MGPKKDSVSSNASRKAKQTDQPQQQQPPKRRKQKKEDKKAGEKAQDGETDTKSSQVLVPGK